MKRKEICEKTGLTPKALRLYEEKGLIRPDMGYPGHYHTRDYSQDDLRRLEMIAVLRRALFTLEEIRRMLDTPESIQEIYPQYLAWLQQQKQQLTQLYEVSAAIDITQVQTIEALTEQLQSAAANMPLPASDIHFRFRQLDRLEGERPLPSPAQRLDEYLPDREMRQVAVSMSRNKWDDFLAMNDVLNDLRTPKKAKVRKRPGTSKAALIIAAWGLVACVIFGSGVVHHINSGRRFYWQGEKYVFRDYYGETLPEDAVYIGSTEYRAYKNELGADLTCNLEELRQARQSVIEGVEYGDAFYSAEKECIYVAVNTEFLSMPGRRYYLFYR